jgi:hypothetical protein
MLAARRDTRPEARLRIVEGRAPWQQTPRWGHLYLLLFATAVVSFAGEIAAPTDGWRRAVDIGAALAAFGAMALWLRANRLRLACQGRHPDDERGVAHRLTRGRIDPPLVEAGALRAAHATGRITRTGSGPRP